MSFLGKYKLVSSENLNEYLKGIGVTRIHLRQMLCASKPITEIQHDGEAYIITTSWAFTNTEIKFILDQEFDEITEDGRECKSVITLEGEGGNKLLHNQNCNGRETEILREFDGVEMKMTMTIKDTGVSCTQVYMQLE